MTSKTLEGMARAICLAIWDHDYTPRDPNRPDVRWLQAVRAAKHGAGFLADNVSDDMVRGYEKYLSVDSNIHTRRDAISAALRAAIEGAP